MAGPSYLVTNALAAAVGITSSSAEVDFPAGNVRDKIAANPFKWSEDVSGGATIFIEIDFGTGGPPAGVDTIAILNHNFPDDTTLSLKTGASAAPAVELVAPVHREFDIWQSFTDPSHQFYRLEVTITSVVAPQIGEIYVGNRFDLMSRRTFQFADAVLHMDEFHETPRGVKKVFGLFDRRLVTAKFKSIQLADIAELAALDQAVSGMRIPFLWIPDTNLTEVLFVRLIGDYRELSVRENEWDVELSMEEESRGTVITQLVDSA